MVSFATAVKKLEATSLPIVEGFAVQVEDDGGVAAVTGLLDARLLGYEWKAEAMLGGWWLVRGTADAAPGLDEAWAVVREVKNLPGVQKAEPLLLIRAQVTSGSEAQRSFTLWGRVSDERLAEIRAASKPMHWSLVSMGVCDAEGNGGAWATWKAKPGNESRIPGEGVLVAQPDTGYTDHPRILPVLAVRPEDPPSHRGRNFVERKAADAATNGRDPMKDRSFGCNPGHGTSVASVIAAGNSPDTEPWGVAPGARILPLRVSSSVILISYQNLCEALVEAMNRRAHVVTLSLGGPLGSECLNDLLRAALDRGVIVVAAAGNHAPTVAFPALVPGVIACAASNAMKAPWRFSGLGAAVAVTAPGELVWHDVKRIDGNGNLQDDRLNTTGTSYATANVAGLAALWLSFHGRDHLIQSQCNNRPELLPFLFRLCLERSADAAPAFIRNGKGGFGVGIAQADKLLTQTLPSVAEVEARREAILTQKPPGMVKVPLSSWWTILTLPTLAADGPVDVADDAAEGERHGRLEAFLTDENGLVPAAAGGLDDADKAEIGTLAGMDVLLSSALARAAQGRRASVSADAVRRYLLRAGMPLSGPLRGKLTKARDLAHLKWRALHPEVFKSYPLPAAEDEEKKIAYAVSAPRTRRLRAFAFDPSLATSSAEAAVNEIVIPIVFEPKLQPGPVGDYLAVVDVDPASDCCYAPVDLNHPFLLAQDGLPRSEGNPQFHQQMVYAVAMKTINHFEEALGRPIFWSSLRSGDEERAEGVRRKDEEDKSDQFVQRLRLYPHALRAQNAYYSPQKRAILFGYFPAGDGDPGAEYPGGVVFTCLAHDIIAHEMTHAILDGMHVNFTESTNPDVFAFHEGFADIVALFQRFTYSELLRDQIAKARGRLDAGTLMTRLALQFGQASGRRQALRDALGHVVEQARQKGAAEWRDFERERNMDGSESRATLADAARDLSDEQTRSLWKRFKADPLLLARVLEPHDRGSILVAAVFDAYLRIYEDRVADLKRIATGGTGVLPDGDLHPDLVSRMADEAAKAAGHVLKMCIRAMDYVPPLDITFGEFLRALITADSDLVPDDDRRYRVAFIEAFRKWGIYPRDVRTLSEETLRWKPPTGTRIELSPGQEMNQVRRALLEWEPGVPRGEIFKKIKKAQTGLHKYFQEKLDDDAKGKVLAGIDTRRKFQVTNLRPARRLGPRGEFLTEMIIEILQSKNARLYDLDERSKERELQRSAREQRRERGEPEEPQELPFRGGVTLIVGMEKEKYTVRYVVGKQVDSASREARQREFRAGGAGIAAAAECSSQNLPAGWYTNDEERKKWRAGRVSNAEDMRASSCACRRSRMEGDERKKAVKSAKAAGLPVPDELTEPFALLHRKGGSKG